MPSILFLGILYLGRYLLIFDIKKRNLTYISYLQRKEQRSLVYNRQCCPLTFIGMVKQVFIRILQLRCFNYYNTPFNKLDDTKIMYFADHMQTKYITHWKQSLCSSQNLNFITFLKTAVHHQFILMLLEKNRNRKTLVKLSISDH